MADTILGKLRSSQHPKLRSSQPPTPQHPLPTTIAAMPALGWLTLDACLVLAFGIALVTLVFAMVTAQRLRPSSG
jgi:hypothetical protein